MNGEWQLLFNEEPNDYHNSCELLRKRNIKIKTVACSTKNSEIRKRKNNLLVYSHKKQSTRSTKTTEF